MATLVPIIPGAAWAALLGPDPDGTVIPSENRVLFVFDSPKTPSPPVRITKEYNPLGGSDSGVSANGDNVLVILSPTDTAACDGHGGPWQLFTFVGAVGEQYHATPRTTSTVQVIVPNQGVIPHG